MLAKGENSVKGHTEEVVVGLNVRGLSVISVSCRPATKGANGENHPGSNLSPLKISELLYILFYLIYVCLLNACLPPSPTP